MAHSVIWMYWCSILMLPSTAPAALETLAIYSSRKGRHGGGRVRVVDFNKGLLEREISNTSLQWNQTKGI